MSREKLSVTAIVQTERPWSLLWRCYNGPDDGEPGGIAVCWVIRSLLYP